SVRDIARLRALGDLIRASRTTDRPEAIQIALATVKRHRANGVAREEIALALGISDRTLSGWQRRAAPKAPPSGVVSQQPTRLELPDQREAVSPSPTLESISQASWQ